MTRRFSHKLVFLFAIVFLAGPARGAERPCVFAIGGMNTTILAQYKSIIEGFLKVFSEQTDYKCAVKSYLDDGAFGNAIRNEADFFFTINPDIFLKHMEGRAFAPLMTISQADSGSGRLCLYVRSKDSVRAMAGLAGRKARTYTDETSYYQLRSLIGRPPEEYFASLDTGPDGVSIVYGLNMSDVDVAFINEITVAALRLSNPGPTRDIRPVVCTGPIMNPPMFYLKKTVTPDMLATMRKWAENSRKDTSVNKMLPLMRTLKLRFLPVAAADYQPLLDLNRRAAAKGWDRAYARWIKLAAPKGK